MSYNAIDMSCGVLLDVADAALTKIHVDENQKDEARDLVMQAAYHAVNIARNEFALETLAAENSVPERAFADSARSRRNARKRARQSWIADALNPALGRRSLTTHRRLGEILRGVDRSKLVARALRALNVDALTDVVFDAETGLRVFSARRTAETERVLHDRNRELNAALRRIGAYDKPRKGDNVAK